MTKEQQAVNEWMEKFGQAILPKPTIPALEVRKLRAKLLLEECLETICGLGFHVKIGEYCDSMCGLANKYLQAPEAELVETASPSLLEILDGCEDLKVITYGTLAACGLSGVSEAAFEEVMRSNGSKLWTVNEMQQTFEYSYDQKGNACHKQNGKIYNANMVAYGETRCWLVKNEDGKVIKSPSYSPANLAQSLPGSSS